LIFVTSAFSHLLLARSRKKSNQVAKVSRRVAVKPPRELAAQSSNQDDDPFGEVAATRRVKDRPAKKQTSRPVKKQTALPVEEEEDPFGDIAAAAHIMQGKKTPMVTIEEDPFGDEAKVMNTTASLPLKKASVTMVRFADQEPPPRNGKRKHYEDSPAASSTSLAPTAAASPEPRNALEKVVHPMHRPEKMARLEHEIDVQASSNNYDEGIKPKVRLLSPC
jgi:hypothetical protein